MEESAARPSSHHMMRRAVLQWQGNRGEERGERMGEVGGRCGIQRQNSTKYAFLDCARTRKCVSLTLR